MSARKTANSSEKNLGGQLRYFRKKLCLRQPDMAKHLGISMSLYSKLEANLLMSPPHTLAKMAAVLNTTVEFLTKGIGPEYAAPAATAVNPVEQLTDENLRRIIQLAQRQDLRELAEKVSGTMKCTPEHALAIIIRTIMLDPDSTRQK